MFKESTKSNLLWVDSLGGLTVGVAMLLLRAWWVRWYHLPEDLLLLMGVMNVLYGLFSLSLAARARRPKSLLMLLIAANAIWAVACLRWATIHAGEATILGFAHLLGEALFVGGLAALEWRWQDRLLQSPSKQA